jgi:aldehyde:ferredoxin oxidoreductase
MGLIYAFSNIGASRLQGMGMLFERGIKLSEYGVEDAPKETHEKVRTAILGQNLCAFVDSAGLCKFGVFGIVDFTHVAAALNAVTGREETKMNSPKHRGPNMASGTGTEQQART